MPRSASFFTHCLTLALLVLLLADLTLRLSSFPGLHGDEGWVGLRALHMRREGFFTVNGMNTYTGALFPQTVAALFSVLGTTVLSLRLPGAIFNWLAAAITAVTFRKRGHSALYFLLLFASSLLFLFYGRVAWEVSALQNLFLALIIAALARLLPADRAGFGSVSLFFLAFALGTWNHLIFLAASLSLALAATFIALRSADKGSARLLLMGAFNLALQGVLLIGKRCISDGPFPTHALPALLGAVVLIVATSIAYLRTETYLLPWIMELLAERQSLVGRVRNILAYGTAASFLLVLPFDGVSFFGTVSGYIVMERVVSYIPSSLETAGLHIGMAILVATFVALAVRERRPDSANRRDALKTLLLIWAIASFPVLQTGTTDLSDRHFIIPQFLFFGALALSIDVMPLRWRRLLQLVLALGFLHAQLFLWHEITRAENRQPIDFRYGFYRDTSWHFLRLDELQTYLRDHGICRVESKSFFIDMSMHFLLAAQPPCGSADAVRIEYCDSCREPIGWFAINRTRE